MKPIKPNRHDIVPVFLVLLLAGAAAAFSLGLFSRGGTLTAVISAGGTEIGAYVLSSLPAEGKTLTVENNGVTLTVFLERDGISVTDSDCAGHDCVRTGKIKKAGRSIVCLPGKIVLSLEGTAADSGPGLDMIAG